jgi:DNA-directed RNA polymerase specialized sigma24 family protein
MPDLELGDLYEEFEQAMLRFGTRISGSRDASEDLVHETFLRAMAHLPLLGRLQRH